MTDGDSSVHTKVIERVPYGREVETNEYMNHTIQNYGKAPFKIKSETKICLSFRKQLSPMVIQTVECCTNSHLQLRRFRTV